MDHRGAGLRRAVRTLRLRAGRHADLRAPRGVSRVGEATDVIRKEMYEFEDKGGRSIALRPEGTAPVVRAYVEHHPTPPWKVWYIAPNFRYERPQKGRYRQHWQLGAEVLGADDLDVDVEVIALAYGFFRELQIPVRLLLNSMGEPADRVVYVERLREYLLAHGDAARRRLSSARRREPVAAPRLETRRLAGRHRARAAAHRVPERRLTRHFEGVQRGLDALGIAYELTPRLVRGFDYYTSTTFELASDALDAAQNALGGGGRYDQLAQDMGGKPTPGIGFGIGIERLLLAADAAGVLAIDDRDRLDAFLIDGIGGPEAAAMLEALRASGLRADRAYGGRSVKAQWKVADRSGAAYGVMLGAEEAARDAVAVKDLTTGAQVDVPRESARGLAPAAPRGRRMMRTHLAGELRSGDIGAGVVVCGWVASRRDHGGVVFLDVRDASGVVQVVVDPESVGGADVHHVRAEYVVRVDGPVRARPEGTVNADLPTGEVEVAAARLEVLNTPSRRPSRSTIESRPTRCCASATGISTCAAPGSSATFASARVNAALRAALDAHGFVEVETPMLIASTPEGARTSWCRRSAPGRFYTLPQSPQLFKQLSDGRWARPLLPDRPLPARRRPARRPAVRVHAARRGDELRRRRRRDGGDRGRGDDASEAVTGVPAQPVPA